MTLALDIGLSALQAHQRALDVTAHNIANAATPGYTRQRVELTSPTPMDTSPGMIGRGVEIDQILRIADELVNERLRQVSIEEGRLEELSKVLKDIELIFNEPSETGLANAINRFFASIQDLSNNPESNAIRSGAIEQMQTFTGMFRSLHDKFTQQRADIQFALGQQAERVNSIAEQVVIYNQQIRAQLNTGNNPNDLLDERDRLLTELAQLMDISVRRFANGGIQVAVGGRLLIGQESALTLSLTRNFNGGSDVIFRDTGEEVTLGSGAMQALDQVASEIIPRLTERLDAMALNLMDAANTIHATGNNDNFRANAFVSGFRIATEQLDTNLDSIEHVPAVGETAGIPEPLLPGFIDANGNHVARNLTLNVYDQAANTARKFVIRYEPGNQGFPNSRTLPDLVDAINTGTGGGFTVFPPSPGGVTGVVASAVFTDGGYRLSLGAEPGTSIDFSRALDLAPAQTAWTGSALTVSRTVPNPIAQIDFLASDRIAVEVLAVDETAGVATLGLSTYDPQDGTKRALNLEPQTTVAVPFNGAGTVLIDNRSDPPFPPQFGLEFAAAGSDFRVGESFVIDFDGGGRMLGGNGLPGPLTIAKQWTADAATVQIKGRYQGEQSYYPGAPPDALGNPAIPGRPWSLEVVEEGVIGAPASTQPPDGPPLVKFTYFSGPNETPVLETVLLTLDDHYPPGSQVAIAEGVYAEFSAGRLYAHDPGAGDANRLEFIVDGVPDQAGLLSALGINGMFQGSGADDFEVAERLIADPTSLLVGHTRAAGDNANLLTTLAIRDQRLMASEDSTLDEYYQTTLSGVAVRLNQSEQLLQNQTALRISLQNQRDAVSGVSIDEEVTLLILHQQAYQAAARIISTERENMQSLLQAIS